MNARHITAIATLLATLAAAHAAHAAAVVTLPPPPPVQTTPTTIDDATRRALELDRTIVDLKADQVSIDNRLVVTSEDIESKSANLELIKQQYKTAQDAYDERVIAMYKFGGLDELAILLDARSLSDLVGRATVLARVLDVDRQTVEAASVVAAQADYEAGVLEDLRAQDQQLRALKDQRIQQTQSALNDYNLLLPGLSTSSKNLIAKAQATEAKTHQLWIDASLPTGTRPKKVSAKVRPYTDRTYRVSEYAPRLYRTTGVAYNAVCSWYGPGFDGMATASGQKFNRFDFTCASPNLPFGTWLALTRGNTRIIVVVNDRGPYVAGRDLDLSAAAARALGFWGVESIGVEIVKPTK